MPPKSGPKSANLNYDLVVDLYEKHSMGKISNKQLRKELWVKVTAEYVALTGHMISADNLANRWRTRMARLKVKRSKNKEGRKKTGGGNNPHPPLNDQEERELDVFNQVDITHEVEYDSECHLNVFHRQKQSSWTAPADEQTKGAPNACITDEIDYIPDGISSTSVANNIESSQEVQVESLEKDRQSEERRTNPQRLRQEGLNDIFERPSAAFADTSQDVNSEVPKTVEEAAPITPPNNRKKGPRRKMRDQILEDVAHILAQPKEVDLQIKEEELKKAKALTIKAEAEATKAAEEERKAVAEAQTAESYLRKAMFEEKKAEQEYLDAKYRAGLNRLKYERALKTSDFHQDPCLGNISRQPSSTSSAVRLENVFNDL